MRRAAAQNPSHSTACGALARRVRTRPAGDPDPRVRRRTGRGDARTPRRPTADTPSASGWRRAWRPMCQRSGRARSPARLDYPIGHRRPPRRRPHGAAGVRSVPPTSSRNADAPTSRSRRGSARRGGHRWRDAAVRRASPRTPGDRRCRRAGSRPKRFRSRNQLHRRVSEERPPEQDICHAGLRPRQLVLGLHDRLADGRARCGHARDHELPSISSLAASVSVEAPNTAAAPRSPLNRKVCPIVLYDGAT